MKVLTSIGKKLTAILLAGSMIFATACGNGSGSDSAGSGENGGKNAPSGDAYEISYWIPMGEDTSYYDTYNENPALKYLEQNYTFNGKPINFDFYVAPAGSQTDNFNTLLSTGEYCDIMDLSMSSETAVQLFDEGILQDLTELVPEHMPNFMAYLEANPDVAMEIYSIVDGEKRILSLTGFYEKAENNFQGFCYRRDWVAKYGTNPDTGKAFTYGFKDENDPYSWEDDVVFPSGGSDPIYISDWEWMFDLFDKALADLGVEDGYCYAPYFQGFMQTGDLACGFGGGGNCYWYRNKENEAVFGPATEDFRAYLQCLNTWYSKGWVDPAFAEHNGDMFYSVDTAKVFSGKVGLWQGLMSTVGTQIDSGDANTAGAMVYGCRQPVNDIYGDESSQNVEPYTYYAPSKVLGSVGVTTKLSEEETIAFLQFVDFMFTEEGAQLALGLSKEQYEACKDEFYTANGLTEGGYKKEGDTYVYNVDASNPISNAMALARVVTRKALPLDKKYDPSVAQAVAQWDYYEVAPTLFAASVSNALSTEEGSEVTNIRNNVDQFMIRSISSIIMGKGYDVWDDAAWEQFCTDINKFQPERVTEIYNEKLQLLEQ